MHQRPTPIERAPIERGSADRNPVEVLAAEFAQRLRQGERPTIDEYVDCYPDHADSIRVLFPPIEMMERISEQEQSDCEIKTPPSSEFRLSRDTIGDFHIIREIGRGGMGVVYEAQQQSLNRRVALKIVGASVAGSPSQLARFRREAEAAARLHHTNIVPVFGMGTDDGLHFYVMQLIDGVALSDVVWWLEQSAGGDFRFENLPAQEPPAPQETRPEETQFTPAGAAAILLSGSVQDRSSVQGSSAPSTITASSSPSSVQPDVDEAQGESGTAGEDTVPLPQIRDEATSTHSVPKSGSYWRSVAKIGADLAGALSYSHQHGVLHRDIKPSNVLLDRDGIVWLADFGLAKHQGQEGVTVSGDIVGTLRYMAPEQFRGQTDDRSDVYSLGLTLYELLTLRPAFDESRHGPLIEQKISATPPSPRRAVPGIPRDLDTIVVKACATEPAHRYQSAGQLAADLRRFLEDRPIRARRVSPAERFWRWARRNPSLATLAASTVALLIATAVVFAVGKFQTERALGQVEQEKRRVETEKGNAVAAAEEAQLAYAKANEHLQAAKRENARAEANLQVAIEAFEEIANNIASRGVPQSLAVVPGEQISAVTPADAELLEGMLVFFDQFTEYNRVDLADESAAALKRVGDIHLQLGRLDAAEKAYREALAVYERLIDQHDSATAYTLEAARIMNAMAGIHSRRGNIPSAIGVHHKARNLLEDQGPPAPAELRFELAKTLIQRRLVSEIAGIPSDEPAGKPGRGRPPRRGRGGPPKQGGFPKHGGPPKHGRGPGRGPDGNALDDCTLAIEILDSLVAEAPSKAEYRLALAQAYRTRVRVFLLAKNDEDAEASLQTAITSLEQLTADYPDSPAIQYELADALRTQGVMDEDYAARVRRAVSLSGALAAENPAIPQYQALAGECLSDLAAWELGAGELEAAAVDYQQAIAHLKPLADRLVGVLPAQLSYAQALAGFADVQVQRGQLSDITALLDDAVRRLETFKQDHKPNRFTDRLLDRIRKRRASLP